MPVGSWPSPKTPVTPASESLASCTIDGFRRGSGRESGVRARVLAWRRWGSYCSVSFYTQTRPRSYSHQASPHDPKSLRTGMGMGDGGGRVEKMRRRQAGFALTAEELSLKTGPCGSYFDVLRSGEKLLISSQSEPRPSTSK